jgi:predicted nucleotide-binding protein
MSSDYKVLASKVEKLKVLLTSKATGGDASDDMFRALRAELRADPDIGPTLPSWLREVRSLDDWWSYIQPLFGQYSERRNYLRKELDPALSRLEDLELGIARPSQPPTTTQPSTGVSSEAPASLLGLRVFVVHGHDHGPRDSVARLLDRLGLEPVILEEQPNKGRTIIEKFVDYSDVEYAVIVMTPDDMGGGKGAGTNQRARQNVILELGFFIGALGRHRVAAVVVGPVETPSDVEGVLYIKYDASGAWKGQLAREIKAAGLSVDLNRLS